MHYWNIYIKEIISLRVNKTPESHRQTCWHWLPKKPFEHGCWQKSPEYPGKQWHRPVIESHELLWTHWSHWYIQSGPYAKACRHRNNTANLTRVEVTSCNSLCLKVRVTTYVVFWYLYTVVCIQTMCSHNKINSSCHLL